MYDLVTIGGLTRDIFILNPLVIRQLERGRHSAKKPYFAFAYGRKIDVDTFFGLGGGAANVAVGVSRLGFRTAVVAKIGHDQEGQDAGLKLKAQGVATNLIVTDHKRHTGFSVIFSSPQGERSVLLHRGANDFLRPAEVHWPKLGKTRWLFISHLSGESADLMPRLVKLAKKKPKLKIAWNIGSTQLKLGWSKLAPLLAFTRVLILNKEEAEQLANVAPVSFTARGLAPLFKKFNQIGPALVTITDGKNGAWFYQGQKFYFVPALSGHLKIVNTLGAGDAFSSGLIAGLLRYGDQETNQASRYAALNGAAVTEEVGAERGLLNRQTMAWRLKRLSKHLVREKPAERIKKATYPAKAIKLLSLPRRIPIEVSARHVHLAKADLTKLFGVNYRPRLFKKLSQAADFAATATITLIGEQGCKLTKVRLVLPVRAKTQVETSASEARQLGLQPPLALSGDLAKAGPITLSGPRGRVKRRAHIIACRHLHIDPLLARATHLHHGQIVKIQIAGLRALTLGQVVVRCGEGFKLAVHLDTDEANAAGLAGGGYGEIIF